MIEILRALSCLSYSEFLEIMNKQDDYYTQYKFNEMRMNLSSFLCELDTSTAMKFIKYGEQKAGRMM